MFEDLPILFVSTSNSDEGFTESKRHFEECRVLNNMQMLSEQLVRLGKRQLPVYVSQNTYFAVRFFK